MTYFSGGSPGMSKIDHRALCRKAAAECVEFARMIADPEIKKTLLTRAQDA
jgi:hypothetical protein